MPPSAAVEEAIASWVDSLEHVHHRIESCSVSIEQPHHHHRKGSEFRVRVSLHLAGHEVVASHAGGDHAGHDDVYTALADAFVAVRRQLVDFTERRRVHSA